MGSDKLSVVCAWCGRIISAAPAGTAVTHTICEACLDRAMTLDENGGPSDPAVYHLPPADFFGDAFKP